MASLTQSIIDQLEHATPSQIASLVASLENNSTTAAELADFDQILLASTNPTLHQLGVTIKNDIATSQPAIKTVSDSPSSGSLKPGQTETIKITFNKAITVKAGAHGALPTITLANGDTATLQGGVQTNSTLTFPRPTPSLAGSTLNLNGATISDAGVHQFAGGNLPSNTAATVNNPPPNRVNPHRQQPPGNLDGYHDGRHYPRSHRCPGVQPHPGNGDLPQ
jgi:hypothetical protein